MFPDVYEIVKGINQSIEEFMSQIVESQKQMVELMKPRKVHHNKHHQSEANIHQQMDPFAMIMSPHLAHQNKPAAPKSDPLFEMMKMMQPQGIPQAPMTHWGNQFQMPTFEQPKFDMKSFNLF